ncbi:MAG: RluA family pseudouridine synthase [Patescibacteria group bacterium]
MNKDIYIMLYEDNYCLVINKPAGVLVHELLGHKTHDTVAAWWLTQKDTTKISWPVAGREGIVHRLDRDTSGALVLAKSPQALEYLQKQFHDRKTSKKYFALVFGTPDKSAGKIESAVTRDPKNRVGRKSTLIDFSGNAKKAVSKYRVLSVGEYHGQPISAIEFIILTGRTHQIRLHAKMLGCPILGDRDYATKLSRRLSNKLGIERQMLHAQELAFRSPENKEIISVKAPLFEDMKHTIKELGLNI